MRYQGLITNITYLILYLSIINLVTNTSLIINSGILGGCGSSIYGICQAFGKDPIGWFDFGNRVSAVFGNPVFLAAYLAMTSPLAFSMAIKENSKTKRWLYILASILIFCGLLFTRTRAGIIAFFFAMGLILFFSKKKIKSITPILCAFLLIFIASNFSQKTNIMGRFISEFFVKEKREARLEETYASQSIGGSAGLRVLMWKGAINMVRDYPLFGIGPETLQFIWPRYAPFEYMVRQQATGVDRVHNEILDVVITRGLVGLVIYISLIFYLFFIIFKAKEKERLLLLGPFTGAIAYLVQNQFSFAEIVITSLFFSYIGIMDLFSTKKPFSIPLDKPYKKLIFTSSTIFFGILLLIQAIPLYLADKAYYQAEGKKDDAAITSYKKALDLNPYERTYYGGLAGLYIDLAASNPAYYKDAIEVLKKANKNIPDESNFYNIIGVAYQREEVAFGIDRKKEVVSAYKDAIRLSPYFIDTWINLGNYALGKGLYDEAVDAFKKALEIQPWREDCIENLKRLFLSLQDRDKGISCFSDLAKINPESPQIHRTLAQLYYEKTDIENFIKECKKTIELDPKDTLIRKNLAMVYYQRKEYEKAISEIDSLLKISPENQEAKYLLSLINKR
jgi:tetratricopeptide (TPR) repeat protein